MKSRKDMLRVLLDTSFILPTLGVDTGREVEEGLKKLSGVAELYYSNFGILESLWVAARLAKTGRFDEERFRRGLKSIFEGDRYKRAEEGYEVFDMALKLYTLGHKDMVDNLLYATSLNLDLRLLTVDLGLRKFLKGKGLKDVTILPGEI